VYSIYTSFYADTVVVVVVVVVVVAVVAAVRSEALLGREDVAIIQRRSNRACY
jgi:hypothetical protein